MRILIRATNWVGDAILALPALRAVRAKLPQTHIAILARPYVADLYADQRVADELVRYEWRGAHAGLRGREKLATDLRAKKFDTALLLQNAFDAAWVAWRARIPERIGYNRDGRGLLLTRRIPVPKRHEIPAHEKFYYLELLRRAGWIDTLLETLEIKLEVPEAKREQAEARLLENGARADAFRIAVGAGASYGSAKCWPPGQFAETLNLFLKQTDGEVILFGTAAEAQVSAAIGAQLAQHPIDMTGRTSIAELPALLSRCQMFVGNDSGAMHVAAAVGLPVVAIFGPTDPKGTAPVTPRCTIVQRRPYCSPCFLRKCPTDHRCMTAVTESMVEEAMRGRMNEVCS